MGTVFRRCRLRQFNMSYKDEDSILNQKYEKQIFYEDFKFLKGLKKMQYKEIQHITTRNSLNWVSVQLLCQ